jgi:hypothetical protein
VNAQDPAVAKESDRCAAGNRTPNPRIKRQAQRCLKLSGSVRWFGLAWMFSLALVRGGPAPWDGVVARAAACLGSRGAAHGTRGRKGALGDS